MLLMGAASSFSLPPSGQKLANAHPPHRIPTFRKIVCLFWLRKNAFACICLISFLKTLHFEKLIKSTPFRCVAPPNNVHARTRWKNTLSPPKPHTADSLYFASFCWWLLGFEPFWSYPFWIQTCPIHSHTKSQEPQSKSYECHEPHFFPTCQVRVSRFYQAYFLPFFAHCQLQISGALPDLNRELQCPEVWRSWLRSGSAHARENVRSDAR